MSSLGRAIAASAAWAAFLLVPSWAHAQAQGEGTLLQNPHAQLVQRYEGTTTCLQCHEAQAKHVFSSIHYQWRADAPNLVNVKGAKIGKIDSTNDFCTNPSISWIAMLTNEQGKVIGNGCSKCHVGLGAKPTEQMTQAQLENIDCLLCHSSGYRRQVVKRPDGALQWAPTAADNAAVMLNIAQNVGRPTNETCLQCHVGSGGGLNFKRGDLETAHLRPTRDFDVHMGSGMQCIQCHQFKDHKVRGGGTQMSGMDFANDQRPQCESCHKGPVHRNAALDRHTAAVYCTTCHIPSFARKDPTDMHRDWSKSEAVKDEGRYEPHIDLKSNVKPVYAWWNGRGEIALLKTAVKREANGKVAMYKPQGSIADASARIYAFKYHTARLPIDAETREMIPVQVGLVFRNAANEQAVKAGAKNYLGRDIAKIGWIDTERWMGLFHEVVPKQNALGCNDCHGTGSRLDWKALGYRGDPMKFGSRKTKVAQVH